ncbi:MAG: D-alanine--D-alanine ligase [Caulobacterales bacterium]
MAKKRVAVLLGGWSSERPVSLVSGAACAAAARNLGHDVVEIDATPDVYNQLKAAQPEVVINALHGPWGEDGHVQAVMNLLGVPYTHSGVLASSLALDKAKAKAVFRDVGLDVADHIVTDRFSAAAQHLLTPPYVVKPIYEGSSVGVLIVREGENRPPVALTDASWTFGDTVMIEQFIPGREFTVAVRGDEALAVTEILTGREFYDFEAKYGQGGSSHVLPAKIDAALEKRAMDASAKAHAALGCRGVSRSDFRYDPTTDRLVILETNTQPGMTPTSLVPEQAAHRGMSFDSLVDWMIGDASCPR